ncbi:MAG: GGDEF domain-containing protein [Lachnospiraceae bacterium]|nr:GGDEF domain-containing protein [Lachnospiraceae bacterium]
MINGKKLIVLCTSRVFDPQIHSFIELLNEKFKANECCLWIYTLNADLYWDDEADSSETSVFNWIMWDKTDAVIVMDEKIKSRVVSQSIIDNAKSHSVPVVVVDGNYEDTISIGFDYKKGFEAIVRHVIEDHKVRKPHFMAGFKDNVFSEERLQIFKNVIEENGIPFSEDMVSYGDFWARPAREATEELIKNGNIPDAMICANDIMAINVSDVFTNAGYKVPDDVIVTGFDGYNEAFLSKPAITTASCMANEFAGVTGDVVLKCLKGEAATSYSVLPRMIRNESCGCPFCEESSDTAMKSFNTGFYRYQDDIRLQHSVGAKMQTSISREDMVQKMRLYYMPHARCIVDKDCFCSSGNFFMDEKHSEEYYVFFDSEWWIDDLRPVDRTQMELSLVTQEDNKGFPLIFNTLDYMNKTMGIVCYSFPSYDLTDYSKTTGISNMISVGLGGYINMQYEQFLLSKVEEMYQIDSLTRLYNRLAFNALFEKKKNDPDNNGTVLTVIMADLDHLKKINDTFGHEAGDKAIASVAYALKAACPEDSLCVRFGGDEMLAFIFGECDPEGISAKVVEILAEKSMESGYRISASCGTYTTTLTPDVNVEDVVKRADEQMYMVKCEHHRQ